MSGFSKLNRGLLLTILVVAGIVVYILVEVAQQAAAKPDIERVCREYIAAATKAAMLPENARTAQPSLTASELDNCVSKAKASLSGYYPDGSKQLPFVLRDLETGLRQQAAAGGDVILSYSKNIRKFSSFTFTGASVTVAVECETTLRRALSSVANGTATDTLTLQNINGSWKVVYASLSAPVPEATMVKKSAGGLSVTVTG